MEYAGLLCLTFLGALVAAWAWGKLIITAANRQAWAATFYDLLIYGAGNVVLLGAWSATKFDPVVLLVGWVASGVGTYWAVRK